MVSRRGDVKSSPFLRIIKALRERWRMEREEIKTTIYGMVEKSVGRKKLKPGDVFKKLAADHGVEKSEAKAALRELMDAGTLVYSYKGGSYVELPPKE
jgi:hypothetical protein